MPQRSDSFTEKGREYIDDLADASKRAQCTSPPVFIPTLTSLRRTIFDELSASLLKIENELGGVCEPNFRRQKVLEGVKLLTRMDRMVESELLHQRLQNPQYVEEQGLSVIHYSTQNESHESPDWVMLGRSWGPTSRTVVEPQVGRNTSAIPISKYHEDELKRRTQVKDLISLRPWTYRLKNTTERLWGTLRYDVEGRTWYHQHISWLWRFVLFFAILVEIAFYCTGIVNSSSGISGTLQDEFFWIAVLWSLASSLLLGWLAFAFGATKRDAVGAFLTGIGLWLVVVQIGQTQLITQLDMS